ncbi:SCA7, zinc-binding domain-containing protein [Lipomyces arxii]|uniref:SCA7, zinc-binding domain-containing protein n=1 Tax=Lipomyces arxii TaxID=56418 RepID=UPI0034CF19B2
MLYLDVVASQLADKALLNKIFGNSGDKVVKLKAQVFAPTLSSSSSSTGLSSSASSSSSLSSAADSDPTWLEYAQILEDEDSSQTSSRSNSPTKDADSPSPLLDAKDRMALLPCHPLTDKIECAICTNCSKPILTHALASHIRSCLERHQNQDQRHNDKKRSADTASGGKSRDSIKLSASGFAKGSTSSGTGGNKASSAPNGKISNGNGGLAGGNGGGGDDSNNNNGLPKGESPIKNKKKKANGKEKEKAGTTDKDVKTASKRKAETGSDEKSPPKKKKKQPLPKAPPKPKGPVDVERQCGVPLPNGGFCARSLTCKSHSMGAKRNVPGRSQPYDVLLAAYQKKNQMKQAALTSSAQLAEDMELANGPVDSDAEVESVMEGVQKSFPVPLERKVVMPVRIKNHFFRMREMFASAFARQI